MIYKMKTAKEMQRFAKKYSDFIFCGKIFRKVSSILDDDEYVFVAFSGLHNYKNITSDARYFYFLTSKRFIALDKCHHIEDSVRNIQRVAVESKLLSGIFHIQFKNVMLDIGGLNVFTVKELNSIIQESLKYLGIFNSASSNGKGWLNRTV